MVPPRAGGSGSTGITSVLLWRRIPATSAHAITPAPLIVSAEMGALLVLVLAWLGAAPPDWNPHLDPAGLREHLDRAVPAALAASGAPGAVVTVVEGPRVLVAEGWGLADVDEGRPMDADTVVRIASLSKTFTASAVAQLEAEGALDIDADVQRYLSGVRIPARHSQPVTVRRLLSHTAGFINYNSGRITADLADDHPAGEDLAAFLLGSMPPQIYAPGRGVLYCNHGNALAGLVVEAIAEVPFQVHVRETIFDPLGMASSGYAPGERTASLATSYVPGDDGLVVQPYWHFHTVPASGVMTTARDMAPYLIMHLQGGTYEGRTVLAPAAFERMRTPVAAIHPALPSYHYAFAFGQTAGHATRSHGGSVPAFLSKMVLFDELGVGVFVAQNAFGDSIADEIIESIAHRFLPPPPPSETIVPEGDGHPPDGSAWFGTYAPLTKHDTAAFTRPRARLLEPGIVVHVDDAGFLTVDGDRFVYTGDNVFRRERRDHEAEAVVFVEHDDGSTWIHRGLVSGYLRPGHASPWLHLPLWGLCALVLVGASFAPLAWMRVPRPHRWRLLATAYASRLVVAGVAVPQLYAAWVDHGQPVYLHPLRFGIPGWVTVVHALVWPGAAALAILAVLGSVRAETRLETPRLRRVGLWAAAAGLCVIALRIYWHVPSPGLLPP